MSKGHYEIASEILQALLQARGTAVAASGDPNYYVEQYLGDEAVAKAYQAIFGALQDPLAEKQK